ncbi:MAG: hypothetical protein JRJ51_16760 [Deltaproteobacteria bacterium]|nr:hypothetical protein [Deltaproteobacteria bacterium]
MAYLLRCSLSKIDSQHFWDLMDALYKLEEMSDAENAIMEALELKDFHNNRPKFKGVGVYTSNPANQ